MKTVNYTFVLICMISWNAFGGVTDTTEWTVLLGGKPAGFLKKWKNADGSFTEAFQYNDRGRGDSTVSTYRCNSDGYLISIDAAGVDYLKKSVFEIFSLKDSVARWENNSEKGEQKLNHHADYMPLKISTGTSYRTYFNSPDSSIRLLPTGKSRLDVVKEHRLDDGRMIRLISTVGSGLTPSFAWIDADDQMFAYPSDWMAFVRKGYESNNTELFEIQHEYEEKFFKDLVKKCTKRYSAGLTIVNATVFDPKTGKKTPKATIRMLSGKIVSVNTGRTLIPEGDQIIDARNKFVMPGLWDMHVHYTTSTDGLLFLGCGVTNVRDMGNAESIVDKKKEIDEDVVLGPRLQVLSGFIDGNDEYAGPVGQKINSVEEGKVEIKKYHDAGYQQIKLYSSIKPEWVKPLAKEAKKYGMRVCGHVPAHMLAGEAIQAGYDEIQHANMIFLNFYGRELDTRTPMRFTVVAEKGASFDFDSDEFKNFIDMLKKRKTVIDPTVTVFEAMFMAEEGKIDPVYESTADRFPLNMQRGLKSAGGLSVPKGMEETYKKSYNAVLKMTKVLFDNGVTIVPGSDGFAGFTLQRELENYVRAGIPNAEVLKIATITSAQVAGKEDRYGTIEPGKIADIIIIDGDPTEHIEDIRRVETVIKNDAVYETKDLLEAISIGYFK
ncbi:MAG: amidohydrolase family protein [Bacteroidota bacterium]